MLELPFTRPLSLNARQHWAVRQRSVHSWRQAAWVLARQAKIPACERVRIQLYYTPRTSRRRDPLNLVAALKAVEDGIVDAGVIPDDSETHHVSVMPQLTPPGPPRRYGNRVWAVVTRL